MGLIRIYLCFFPLLCKEKLNYLGEVFPVLPLAGSWFKLNPSVLLFPLPMLHTSPVNFPSRCLLCRAPWDVQVPSSQLGCSGTASAPFHCIPAVKRGDNFPLALPPSSSCQVLKGECDLITMLAVRERNQLESTAVWEGKAVFDSMSVLLQLGIAQTCSGGVFHHSPSPQPPAQVSWRGNRVFSIMQVPCWEAAAAPGSPGALVSVGARKQKSL